MSKHQAEPSRVGQFQQARDLVGRLHVAGAVMVEDRPQPGLVSHRARHLVRACGEHVPFRRAQAHAPAVIRPALRVRSGTVPLLSASTR